MFAWDTTGLADGTYQIGVWAKQQYSVKTHDAYAFNTYTLAPTPLNTTQCQAANIAVSPPSPSLKGTTVTLTANQFGCNNPEFRWWIQNTLGAWQIVQDYPTATNTYTWLTSSRPAGTYLLGIWVRQKGSTAAHEAYGYLTYTLTVPPPQFCSSVNLTPDQPSPQAPGTTIVFTGVANGCNHPSYQFWVLAPGTTAWTVIQPYDSISNSFGWDTSLLAPGSWQVGVWAKQTGATASREAFAIITYQLQVMAPPCSTMTVSAAPGQIVERGPGAIQFDAVASGCSAPAYRLYLRHGNGVFVFWGYPDAATTTFTVPLGLLNGHWTAEVFAKDASSRSAYDTVAFTDFTVN